MLTPFLEEISRHGTYHRLVDLYLLRLLQDKAYCACFSYFVKYDARAEMGEDEYTEEFEARFGGLTVDLIRWIFEGDRNAYPQGTSALCRNYTEAILRAAEALAISRDPITGDTEREAAVRDFAHELHTAVSGGAADLQELARSFAA